MPGTYGMLDCSLENPKLPHHICLPVLVLVNDKGLAWTGPCPTTCILNIEKTEMESLLFSGYLFLTQVGKRKYVTKGVLIL